MKAIYTCATPVLGKIDTFLALFMGSFANVMVQNYLQNTRRQNLGLIFEQTLPDYEFSCESLYQLWVTTVTHTYLKRGELPPLPVPCHVAFQSQKQTLLVFVCVDSLTLLLCGLMSTTGSTAFRFNSLWLK